MRALLLITIAACGGTTTAEPTPATSAPPPKPRKVSGTCIPLFDDAGFRVPARWTVKRSILAGAAEIPRPWGVQMAANERWELEHRDRDSVGGSVLVYRQLTCQPLEPTDKESGTPLDEVFGGRYVADRRSLAVGESEGVRIISRGCVAGRHGALIVDVNPTEPGRGEMGQLVASLAEATDREPACAVPRCFVIAGSGRVLPPVRGWTIDPHAEIADQAGLFRREGDEWSPDPRIELVPVPNTRTCADVKVAGATELARPNVFSAAYARFWKQLDLGRTLYTGCLESPRGVFKATVTMLPGTLDASAPHYLQMTTAIGLGLLQDLTCEQAEPLAPR